jgi:hypothetical protein
MRVLSLLFLLLTCNGYAQNKAYGEIKGTLTSYPEKISISNGIVTIPNTATITHTDSAGVFTISPLEPGLYNVCFHATGFVDDTLQNVVVVAGKTTYVSPELIPVNYEELHKPAIRVFRPQRACLVGGAEALLVSSSLIFLNELWYKQYAREPFHTFNDNSEWMQMDKIGHMQTAYTTGYITTGLWDWTGIDHKKAVWIGGLTGFSYLSAIEIMDGYSTGWGFSTGDMLANATGSALFIGQEFAWHEQRIQPKFGYQRSGYAQYRPDLLGSTRSEQLLKDYNGQTYWLSINIASFLNDDMRFPQWLNVAFGYGANGMTGGRENPVMYNSAGNVVTINRYRQYYLSLDLDLRKIPVKSPLLRAVFNALCFIKIPAPSIEVNKFGVRGYVLMF